MEVTEAATGQTVEKLSSSSSETLNETAEKCMESQVVNNDTAKTVSVSETVQALPTCKTEIVEESIEEVEVTDDSDGEDIIEVFEIEKEIGPEKTETKSNDTENSKDKNDIASVVETTVPQVDKAADSLAVKAENAEQTENDEEELEDEEEEAEEEEEEKEVEGVELVEVGECKENVEQPIEQYSEIVDSERHQHIHNDTALIEEDKPKIKSTFNDISVERADEKNTSIAIEKSEIPEMQQFSQQQNTEVFVANKLAEMQFFDKTPNDYAKNQETKIHINKDQVPIVMKPVPEDATNSHRECIRTQLQEIVSDIDRAVEESQRFTNPLNMSSTITSQNNTNTELLKRTSNSVILSPPSYFNQEDKTPRTASASAKEIDLKKIFTPAENAEEIVPHKNRKLYASSAFFTPGLHPTVEDQVELARRISSSLSDANNKLSKGQSMYVNRKKRSVKWIHEGEGKNDNLSLNGHSEQRMPGDKFGDQTYTTQHHESKIPLKLVMDPRGVLQDVYTQGITFDHNSGMLSPDKCAELVSALHTDSPKGKGAELFAKRRKRSEKWIVDETTRSANNPMCTSYSAGPAPIYDTNEFDIIEQQQWGNSREQPLRNDFSEKKMYQPSITNYNQDYQTLPYSLPKHMVQPLRRNLNSQRDLAYKPSVPQGWNAPPPNLPNEMFTPPEIPLSGYTPPQTDIYLPKLSQTISSTSSYYPHQHENARASSDLYHQSNNTYYPKTELYHRLEPTPSCEYVKLSQIYSKDSVPNFTPKPFTPSPIAHEKLAFFEPNKSNQPQSTVVRRPLTMPNQAVHNISQNLMGFNSTYDPNQNTDWRNSNEPKKLNRLSTSSIMKSPINSANFVVKSSCQDSYQENHNRAARGWGQSKDFYRPISFIRPQPVDLPYTDF